MSPSFRVIISNFFIWGLATSAYALPGFSRQTQMACSACHYSSMPALNETGRQFQINGYTSDSDIKRSEDYFNNFWPSVVARFGYVERQGEPYESFEWPDKASVYLAGPIAKNVSYLIEIGAKGGEKETNSDQVNNLLSSKIIFKAGKSRKTQYLIIPFSTYDQGPGYPLELMNTGGRHSLNAIEGKTGFSAAKKLGISQSRATGLGIAAIGEDYYVSYSSWVPAWWKDEKTQHITQCANYLRYARFSHTKQWNIGYGLQTVFHHASNETCEGRVSNDMRGAVADVQFESSNYGKPFGVYASYGTVGPDTFHNDKSYYETALGLGVKGSVTDKTSLYIATMHYQDGSTSSGLVSDTQTYGIEYRFGEQIKFDFYADTDSNASLQLYMGM